MRPFLLAEGAEQKDLPNVPAQRRERGSADCASSLGSELEAAPVLRHEVRTRWCDV